MIIWIQFTVIVSIAVTTVGAYTDYRWKRILNVITLPAMLFGVAYGFLVGGIGRGIERVVLMAIMYGIGALGLLGMGDLKLLMAIGTLNGTMCMLYAVAISSLILLFHQLLRDRRATMLDIKAGIYSLLSRRFDNKLGTGRKVRFAPYVLIGLIGGVLICFR